MNRTLRTAVAAALLLAAGQAWALGLGQIEVKSRRNQPLLAEIPIISTTPGELAALQARLASPETFRRVGLSPPSGIAADLQFSLGSDSKGRPVIRVTTLKPVDQGVLNFLIEVDWGSGRLVREYSALIDVPNAAAGVVQAPVQLPQPPAENLVQRPAPAVAAPAVAASAPAPAPAAATPPAPESAASSAIAVAPLPAAPAAPRAAATATSAMEYGPVKAGETLSKIAGKLGLRQAGSLDQALLALLRANPDAFLGDDVNRLRQGAVLRVPSREDVAAVDAGEAAQIVGQQMRQWWQAHRAVRQPEASAAAPASAAMPAAPAAASPPAPAARAPAATSTTATRGEARLQILPPAAPGKAKGIQSGTSAGGEGSMLQQELRQRDEDIAAKSAEIGELKERVAALEKLKDEQQKLIALKDSELAAAQARLAQASKAGAQAAPASAKPAAAAQPASAPAAESKSGVLPYVGGGLGVVVLAVLAWWLASRRKPAPPPPRRRVFDSEALAASMTAATAAAGTAPMQDAAAAAPADAAAAADEAADAEMPAQQEPAGAEASVTAQDPAPPATPHTAEVTVDLASLAPAVPAVPRADAPQWHSGWVKAGPDVAPASPAPTPVAAPAAVEAAGEVPAHATPEQRFKLVRAFLDMGDEHSAQQLLLELLDDKDEAVSDEAARMLSKLVG
ncbi:type IV pilus assembly protein FimV [Thermomonas sp.]|uniref:type IV pilus assembly protein FimV n=1 Tax=Thermomonas sp. TaxID=1971895 RepID=UPI001AC62E24|nr:ferrous iron transporter B [Xanthomonadales bacterium]MBN8768094.1 ferrous iron transporter B [Stenotrophomonas sp.]